MTDKQKIALRNAKAWKQDSANALTKSILQYLNMQGYVAWRNNTMGVFDAKQAAGKLIKAGRITDMKQAMKLLSSCYRKSHERKGVADIVGYEKKTGRAVYVEVKYGKDKLSDDQRNFLKEADRNGAMAILARNMDGFMRQLFFYENKKQEQ